MKYCTVIVLYLIPLISFGQITTSEFEPIKWEPPYSLDVPAGWDIERFPIPISFAPEIHYKGIEDIRFMPSWGKAESSDYWSYAFLWYLDGQQKITTNILEENLKIYYTGLVNAMKGDSSDKKPITVNAKIKKVKSQKGDLKTFYGSVYMLDYKANKPIALNCKVHLKSCEKKNKTYLFYEISPKPYSDLVWQSLDILWTNFSCSKFVETK